MVIAYFIGKFEENPKFSWVDVIEGGIFELLQQIVLTDLKPQVLRRIRENPSQYSKLNEWVYEELKSLMSAVGNNFDTRFKDYLLTTDETVNRRILSVSHYYATAWEFAILERANPNGYEMDQIAQRQEQYYDLRGMKELILHPKYRSFINLAGELRFQVRWAQLHRVPKTSVLGHMLFVAILSYLFSLQIDADHKTCVNNYFTGLFHDLPEILTRDIISPVKKAVKGLGRQIKKIEQEFMKKEVYDLLPEAWHTEIELYTKNEFKDVEFDDGTRRDGSLVKAADELAALVEACEAVKNGSPRPEFTDAMTDLTKKYKNKSVAGLSLGTLFNEFRQ